MTQTSPLSEQEARVHAAQRRVERARMIVKTVKRCKPESIMEWVGRLFAFRTSPSLRALKEAEQRLATVTQQGQDAARAWIVNTARQQLAANAADSRKHLEHRLELERANALAAQVRDWLELAETAEHSLKTAQSACASASTSEMMDAVSKSKTMSALSTAHTSVAKLAVENAQSAVKALTRALPSHRLNVRVDLPNDLLDLALDLALAPRFDLLSLWNMGQLSAAANRCQQAINQLRPLCTKLRQQDARAQARVESEQRAMRRIEEPYLTAAAAQVPAVLRVPVPEGLFA